MRFLNVTSSKARLAVLPEADRVALAQVNVDVEAGQRISIEQLEVFRIESNALDALKVLRRSHHLDKFNCTTLLAAEHYRIVQLDTPSVPLAEQKEALRWKLKAIVSFPVDDACLDFIEIPNKSSLPGGRPAQNSDLALATQANSLFAVIASAENVRRQAQCFEQARIRLDSIDIPELAQRNVAVLFEEPQRGLLCLRLDHTGGLLTLTVAGELIAFRRVEVSALHLALEDAEMRARAMDRLLLEVQRSLDHFDRQHSYINISRLLVASAVELEHLVDAITESVDITVQAMDLAEVLELGKVPALRSLSFQAANMLAIGAALRRE
ncbi:MAG: hypothetical protein V4623_04905 [Pseudomonadota bacterium]